MSEQERETEEEGGGASDTAPMLPRRLPDRQASDLMSPGWAGLAAQGLGVLLLPGRALAGLVLHLLLPAAVFLLLLLPAATTVYLGFLCHSRVSCAVHGCGAEGLSGVLGECRSLEARVPLPEELLLLPSPPPPLATAKEGLLFATQGEGSLPSPEASQPCTRSRQGLDSWAGWEEEEGSRKRR